MSLDNLPEIEFCATDTAEIESNGITLFEGITERKLYPGSPERLFLEGLLAIIAQQRVVINESAKMNLLRYAVDEFLDHKGAMTETERLEAAPAITMVDFVMAAPLTFVVTIDIGTLVTPDNKIMFATTEIAEIAIGDTSMSLSVTCTVAGEIGNGFVAGQINRIVGGSDYITSVVNTTTANGGAEKEDNDNFRERIRLSPERLSTAGPDGAYEFWAKTAHQDIHDVAVYSPAAMQVAVRPLLKDGGLPTAEILTLVEDILSVRTRRPLTDQVLVSAPEQVVYDLTATYYIGEQNSTLAAQIQTAVELAKDNYIAWQREKLGRDINPGQLNSLLTVAGAKRVEIISPGFTILSEYQVASLGAITLAYGGLEDE